MSKTVSLWGATYSNVPAIEVPSGNSTAKFIEPSPTTATASDVAQGKIFFDSQGNQQTGTASTGGGAISIVDTQDSHGGTIRTITAEVVTTGTEGTPTATKGSVSNHSISVTPSVTNTAGMIQGGTHTGTAVTVTASELVSGDLAISQNGNNIDVTNYQTVSVSVSGGTSKNVQVHQSTTRATSSTYTNCNSLTCTKTAKYTVYWSTMRSSTSGTSGSQLYIGGTAYGTADTTTWNNHVQNMKLTSVQINADQTVAVYTRSRGSNYYAYAPLLTIVEE